MKTTIKTLFPTLMLLAISCKKESSTIQSSGITGESATQDHLTDINELGANAVRIGTQVWMKKKLNVTHYRNGDPIPQGKSRVKWRSLNTGAWCWYSNDSANGAIYGKLYNWSAVNDPRGLAPAGWHIPSDAEWTTLTTFLGGDVVAGGKMKSTGIIEAGTGLWYAPNTDATNSSGFTGLPGGYRPNNSPFDNIGYNGYWWSSTEYNTTTAFRRWLFYYDGSIHRGDDSKRNGYSVRCLKD